MIATEIETRSRFVFALARPEDDAELRAVTRRNPMGRFLRVTFEREPGFLDAAAIQGDFHQTVILRARPAGQIVGMGARSVGTAFLNGAPGSLGYLSDLRLDEPFRGGTLVARGYRFLGELHGDRRAELYTTVIFADNQRALRTIATGRAGLPLYHDCGSILCPGIRLKRPRPEVECGCEVARGDSSLLSDVVDCLNRNNRRKQFAPFHRIEDFGDGGRWRDLRPEDFYVAQRRGRIVGVIARWDQRRFKQTRVAGYGGLLRWTRGLFRLPKVGGYLPYCFGSLIAVDDDDVAVFRALLRRMYNDAVGSEFLCCVVGLHERDPLAAALKDYSLIPFAGRLFCVCFEDGEEMLSMLDARVPYVEAATL